MDVDVDVDVDDTHTPIDLHSADVIRRLSSLALPRTCVTMGDVLGCGEFGEVIAATVDVSKSPRLSAGMMMQGIAMDGKDMRN